MRSALVVCSVLIFALAGCASDTGQAEAESESPKASATTSNAPSELGTIKASGFGQDGEYVWVTAVVHNNSTYVGQTVTVNFNVLDEQGEILESESQVESFSRPKSDHAIGTQVTLEPGKKAAKVEATLDVEAAGAFSDQPFPEMPTSVVKVAEEYGAQEASFELTNPMSEAVKSPRIQLVCTDARDSIVGGGMAFPDLVPAGGKIKVDTNVIVSGKPQECSAYVGAPSDWEGEAAASPTQGSAEPSGSAEEAFKVWVDQFGKKDWKAQYKNLVSAQREVISEREYVACRTAEPTPGLSWVKVLSVADGGDTKIPGTQASLASTKVTAQVEVDGTKAPVDAHMYLENGTWKWSMTKENIAGCTS